MKNIVVLTLMLWCRLGLADSGVVDEFVMDGWEGFVPLGNYAVEVGEDGRRAHHLSNLQGRSGGAINGRPYISASAGAELKFTFAVRGEGMAGVIVGFWDANGNKLSGRDLPKFELTPEWKICSAKVRVPTSDGRIKRVEFRFRGFNGAELWLSKVRWELDRAANENFEGDVSKLTEKPDEIIRQFVSHSSVRLTATACYRGNQRREIAFRENCFSMPQVTKTASFDSSVRIYPIFENRRHKFVLNMNFDEGEDEFRLKIEHDPADENLRCSLIERLDGKEQTLGSTEVRVASLPADFRVSAMTDGKVVFHSHSLSDASKAQCEVRSDFFSRHSKQFATGLEFLPGDKEAEIIIDEYAIGAGIASDTMLPVPYVIEKLPTFDPVKAGWKLVFEDDFNGAKIDEQVWEVHPHGEGYWSDYWPELAFVSNGYLHVRADWNAEHTRLRTSSVRTWKKYLYGYFEARLRFTRESGWWAAFWLYRKNKVTNPFLDGIEYDIFEDYFTRTPKPGGEHKGMLAHNIHAGGCGVTGTGKVFSKNWNFSSKLPGSLDDFYTLGCRWTPFETSYYLNGKLIGTFDAVEHAACLEPLQPVFSGQLMSPNSACYDARGFKFPEDFLVDWIRVYEFPRVEGPQVQLATDVTSSTVRLGDKVRFSVAATPASDGAKVKAVYLFDSGYLLECRTIAPYDFDVIFSEQYYGATRWARAGLTGEKAELENSRHHAFAAFVLDEQGRYSASEIIKLELITSF